MILTHAVSLSLPGSLCLSVCECLPISLCQLLCLSIFLPLSLCTSSSLSPSLSTSIHLSLSVSLHLSFSHSFCLCLCLFLLVFLSLSTLSLSHACINHRQLFVKRLTFILFHFFSIRGLASHESFHLPVFQERWRDDIEIMRQHCVYAYYTVLSLIELAFNQGLYCQTLFKALFSTQQTTLR